MCPEPLAERNSDTNKSTVAARKGGFFFKDPLPASAKFYILPVTVAGLAILVLCLYRSVANPDPRWLYLVALTVAASCLPVTIPWLEGKSQSLTVTLSDLFIFGALLLFDPQVATIAAAVEGVVSSFRVNVKRLYKRLFNSAQLAVTAFIIGHLFYKMEPGPLSGANSHLALLLIKLALCAGLYFVLNSGMVGLAVSLVTRQHFIVLWKQHFVSLAVTSLVNGTAAGVIVTCLPSKGFSVVLAMIPSILVFYHLRRVSLRGLRTQDGVPTH